MTRHLGTLVILAALLLAGCAPERQYPGPVVEAPHIDGDVVITADDFALPMRRWLPGHAKEVAR